VDILGCAEGVWSCLQRFLASLTRNTIRAAPTSSATSGLSFFYGPLPHGGPVSCQFLMRASRLSYRKMYESFTSLKVIATHGSDQALITGLDSGVSRGSDLTGAGLGALPGIPRITVDLSQKRL
jgi:hypothetical protein